MWQAAGEEFDLALQLGFEQVRGRAACSMLPWVLRGKSRGFNMLGFGIFSPFVPVLD